MRRWARRKRLKRRWRYLKHRYGSASLDVFSRELAQDRKVHHDAVVATIPPEQLLVFDIEADDPERLCLFCDLPVSAAALYGHRNRSDDDARYYLGRLLGCLPDPVRRFVQPIVRLAWQVVRKWLPSGAAGRTVDRSR